MNRNGTNELISGDKPFIAILSNLRCLFTRLDRHIPIPIVVGIMVAINYRNTVKLDLSSSKQVRDNDAEGDDTTATNADMYDYNNSQP